MPNVPFNVVTVELFSQKPKCTEIACDSVLFAPCFAASKRDPLEIPSTEVDFEVLSWIKEELIHSIHPSFLDDPRNGGGIANPALAV